MYDGAWLIAQFRRTGLPRSGLAAYLEIDNAAVSRAARDKRRLTAEEALRAEAHFSVVPAAADSEFLQAVRRLRAPEIRTRATEALASWLRARARSASSGIVSGHLARVERGEADLRADQIVALARSEGLDLVALVKGDGAQPDKRSVQGHGGAAMSPSDRLAAAARLWAPRDEVVYQFERGALPVRSGTLAETPHASAADIVVLREGDRRLEGCTPYLVADDSLSPRFEQGETIYLEPKGREIRRGEYVAVLLNINRGRAAALVGRLRFETKDAFVVQPPRSGPREIAKSEILDIRRVAFCAL